jgi:hypothetical protein
MNALEVPCSPEGPRDVSGVPLVWATASNRLRPVEAVAAQLAAPLAGTSAMAVEATRPGGVSVVPLVQATASDRVHPVEAAAAQLAAPLAGSSAMAEDAIYLVERRGDLKLKSYRFLRSRPRGSTPTQAAVSSPLFCIPAELEEMHSRLHRDEFCSFCSLCWVEKRKVSPAG